MNRLHPKRSESGFTLIEVLIVLTLMGVIVSAVAGAFIVSARGTDRNSSSLPGPRVANNLGFWLTSDISSAAPVNAATWLVGPAANTGCGVPVPTGTVVLRIETRDPIAATITYAASYIYDSSAATLTRVFCRQGQPPMQRAVLAEDIDPASPPVAAIPAKDRATLSMSILHRGVTYPVSVTGAVRVPEVAPAIVTSTTTTKAPIGLCRFVNPATVLPSPVGRVSGGPNNNQLLLGVVVSIQEATGPGTAPCTLLRATSNSLSCDLARSGSTWSATCFGPGSPNASVKWNGPATNYNVAITDRVDPGDPLAVPTPIPPTDVAAPGPTLTLRVT